MKLKELIQKLQSKPYHIRIIIMWLAVFICMIVIVGGWIWSFHHSVKSANQEKQKNLSEEVMSSIKELKKELSPSLWQSLGAGIKNVFERAPEEAFQEELQEELKVEEEPEVNETKPARLPEIK